MWVVQIENFLKGASGKVACLILILSIIFLLPGSWVSGILSFLSSWIFWVSDLGPGFQHHHQAIQDAYGTEILIAFFVSLVMVLFALPSFVRKTWSNWGRKLEILKATYGTDASFNDVTDRVRELVKEDKLILTADDDILLEPGGTNDPARGQTKTLKITYKYKIFTVKCKQREQVEIVTIKVTPEN